MLDPASMGAQLVTFLETSPTCILRIIDCDGVAAVPLHDCETWHVGRTISDVDHVLKRNGPHFRRHVVIDIIIMPEHSLVDPEEKLGLGRM